jgi:hypothetical protein
VVNLRLLRWSVFLDVTQWDLCPLTNAGICKVLVHNYQTTCLEITQHPELNLNHKRKFLGTFIHAIFYCITLSFNFSSVITVKLKEVCLILFLFLFSQDSPVSAGSFTTVYRRSLFSKNYSSLKCQSPDECLDGLQ